MGAWLSLIEILTPPLQKMPRALSNQERQLDNIFSNHELTSIETIYNDVNKTAGFANKIYTCLLAVDIDVMKPKRENSTAR